MPIPRQNYIYQEATTGYEPLSPYILIEHDSGKQYEHLIPIKTCKPGKWEMQETVFNFPSEAKLGTYKISICLDNNFSVNAGIFQYDGSQNLKMTYDLCENNFMNDTALIPTGLCYD